MLAARQPRSSRPTSKVLSPEEELGTGGRQSMLGTLFPGFPLCHIQKTETLLGTWKDHAQLEPAPWTPGPKEPLPLWTDPDGTATCWERLACPQFL